MTLVALNEKLNLEEFIDRQLCKSQENQAAVENLSIVISISKKYHDYDGMLSILPVIACIDCGVRAWSYDY